MMGKQKSAALISIAALVLILLMAVNPTTGNAEDATATQAATASPTGTIPTPPYGTWAGYFRVKSGVPFLWLRRDPSSEAGSITTIYPGRVFTAYGSRVWDGVQWWGYVLLPPLNTGGWVELGLIEPVATVPPTVTPAPSAGKENWTTATTVRVKAAIPFVWLRADAASDSGVLLTVAPQTVLAIAANEARNDSRQWWWAVRHPMTGVTGWVEQGSLDVVSGVPVTPNPVSTAQPWILNSIVRVRAEVPFSWLRRYYSSWSQPLYTVNTGTWLQIVTSPQYDGIQWWWKVRILNTTMSGWVEQKSLELPVAAG